jgi:hypothetical protein
MGRHCSSFVSSSCGGGGAGGGSGGSKGNASPSVPAARHHLSSPPKGSCTSRRSSLGQPAESWASPSLESDARHGAARSAPASPPGGNRSSGGCEPSARAWRVDEAAALADRLAAKRLAAVMTSSSARSSDLTSPASPSLLAQATAAASSADVALYSAPAQLQPTLPPLPTSLPAGVSPPRSPMWADESRDESRDELRWARSSPARREEVFPQATTPKWLKDAAAMLPPSLADASTEAAAAAAANAAATVAAAANAAVAAANAAAAAAAAAAAPAPALAPAFPPRASSPVTSPRLLSHPYSQPSSPIRSSPLATSHRSALSSALLVPSDAQPTLGASRADPSPASSPSLLSQPYSQPSSPASSPLRRSSDGPGAPPTEALLPSTSAISSASPVSSVPPPAPLPQMPPPLPPSAHGAPAAREAEAASASQVPPSAPALVGDVAAQPPPDMLAALRERYAAARRAALPGKAESSLPTSLPCDPGQGPTEVEQVDG